MIKSHVLLLFLLALHLVDLPKLHAAEVMWDYSKDIIYYEGKLYYPDQNVNTDNKEINQNGKSSEIPEGEKNDSVQSQKLPISEDEDREKEKENENEEEEEEELATGGRFWFCIFMIFSKLTKFVKLKRRIFYLLYVLIFYFYLLENNLK